MQIFLNGKPCQLDNVITVQDLLGQLELQGWLAVEINQEIIPRSHFHSRKINPGDNIEIVHAIGGGQPDLKISTIESDMYNWNQI